MELPAYELVACALSRVLGVVCQEFVVGFALELCARVVGLCTGIARPSAEIVGAADAPIELSLVVVQRQCKGSRIPVIPSGPVVGLVWRAEGNFEVAGIVPEVPGFASRIPGTDPKLCSFGCVPNAAAGSGLAVVFLEAPQVLWLSPIVWALKSFFEALFLELLDLLWHLLQLADVAEGGNSEGVIGNRVVV